MTHTDAVRSERLNLDQPPDARLLLVGIGDGSEIDRQAQFTKSLKEPAYRPDFRVEIEALRAGRIGEPDRGIDDEKRRFAANAGGPFLERCHGLPPCGHGRHIGSSP